MKEFVVSLPSRIKSIVRVGGERSMPAAERHVPQATLMAAAAPPPAPSPATTSDRAAVATLVDRFESSVRDLQQRQDQQLGAWKQAAIELALTIAARLVHQQLDEGQFAVEALVR